MYTFVRGIHLSVSIGFWNSSNSVVFNRSETIYRKMIHHGILLTTRYTVQWVHLTILMTRYDWVLLTILAILFQQITSLVPKSVKINEIKITFLFLNQNLFSYINFFLQILVLIFMDACGKSLRRKKWWRTQTVLPLTNVTIRIAKQILYRYNPSI